MRLNLYSQIITFLLLSVGVFLTHNLLLLLTAYIIIIILISFSNQLKLHLRMLFVANVPYLLFLLLVFGVIINNHKFPHNQTGIHYSLVLFFRVTILTSLCQYIFNVPGEYLFIQLKKIGLKGVVVMAIVGSFSVWRDFTLKAERLITARLARGHLKKRNLYNRLKQFPFIIKPLLAGALTIGLERSASWKQRRLFDEINQINQLAFEDFSISKILSLMIPIITLCWFVLIVFNLTK